VPAHSTILAHWILFLLPFVSVMLSSLLGLFSSCFWVCSFSERSHEAKELFGFLLLGYDKRGVSWVRLEQTSRKKMHWGYLREVALDIESSRIFFRSVSDGLFV
jgi:hypothetical protein